MGSKAWPMARSFEARAADGIGGRFEIGLGQKTAREQQMILETNLFDVKSGARLSDLRARLGIRDPNKLWRVCKGPCAIWSDRGPLSPILARAQCRVPALGLISAGAVVRDQNRTILEGPSSQR